MTMRTTLSPDIGDTRMTDAAFNTHPRAGTRIPAGGGRPWPRRRRRGLVNVLLTVAIAAVVISGIVATAVVVNNNVRAQQARLLIGVAENRIRQIYATLPQFDADMSGVVVTGMPSNAIQWQGGTDVIVTPWGGLITAGGGATPGTGVASGNRFWIVVADLPEAACESIAQSFLNNNTVVGIQVLGDPTDTFTAMTTDAAIQAFDTPAEIQAGCDGGTDDRVGIVYRS